MPKLSKNFKEILSCSHGNFEEQNQALESSIIIINYLIIINKYYKYTINAQKNYYMSNNGLLEECDKEKMWKYLGLLLLSF